MAAFVNIITLAYTVMFVAVFLTVHLLMAPFRFAGKLWKRLVAKIRGWRRASFLGA